MRRLISLLLIVAVVYAAWFYLKDYSTGPTQVRLLRAEAASINRVSVSQDGGKNELFRLQRGDGARWMAIRKQRLVLDTDGKMAAFIQALSQVRSDSVVHQRALAKELPKRRLTVRAGGSDESFTLIFPSGPTTAVYARMDGESTLLALPPSCKDWLTTYLEFDGYRERRLLDLSPLAVDSIAVLKSDSLLWGINAGDLSATAQRFIAPASAPFADYFDEIAHQDRTYARIRLYSGAGYKTVTVYRDSLWPLPFVLMGEDYPRRFLGYDALR